MKSANREDFVRHAMQVMNAWITMDFVLSGTIGSFIISDTYRCDAILLGDDEIENGVNTGVITDEVLTGQGDPEVGLPRDALRGMTWQSRFRTQCIG